MGNSGELPAKSFVDFEVNRSRNDVFDPADDVANFHEVVVYHRGQMVGGNSITLHQNFVVHLTIGNRNFTLNHIVPSGVAFLGHPDPDCPFVFVGDTFGD